MTPIFTLPMEVRDYECDFQCIVNNANYMRYAEHCRAVFLQRKGIMVDDLHRRGIDVVVAEAALRFKASLRPGDHFEVRLALEKKGLRYVFHQDIVRLPCAQRALTDEGYGKELLCFRARTDVVAIVNGRLSDCPELNETFQL